jgi:hypothetical protein
MSQKQNWTKGWKPLIWKGLTNKQLTAKKAAYKKKAIVNIKKQIDKLFNADKVKYEKHKKKYPKPKPKRIKFTNTWSKEKLYQRYHLNTYITRRPRIGPPPSIFAKLGSSNPPPPPQP